MSLISTTIYNAPVWSVAGFDYLTGNETNPLISLPDYFNKHTLWLAHFMFPNTLLPTTLTSLRQTGLFVDFISQTPATDYPIYFMRPPSVSSAAGTIASAGLGGPGLISNLALTMQYLYGIGGGASGLANIIGTWSYDTTLTLPLSQVSSPTNIIDHFAPNAMTHVSVGGTNTVPNGTTVMNMGICHAIEIDFAANQIQINCPNLSALIAPTNGQPYWAYGFVLVKSEQV